MWQNTHRKRTARRRFFEPKSISSARILDTRGVSKVTYVASVPFPSILTSHN